MPTSEHLDAAYDAGYMAGDDATNPHHHPALRQQWDDGHCAGFLDRGVEPSPMLRMLAKRSAIGLLLLLAAGGALSALQ